MKKTKPRGFTLIEVSVALVILSWVLGSAIFMVQQYADERLRLRERFFSSSVAWNRLMERYQEAEGWNAKAERPRSSKKGIAEQAGEDWRWEMNIEAAMGENLYRYQVNAGLKDSDRFATSLSIFLIDKP
ncbi:type II secretion system minor pseudopilin GspI [SAR92 clade bacterium H921]|nr:type II secretion system minor pseudopilin GspI [SAR92 clade bacterium H921]